MAVGSNIGGLDSNAARRAKPEGRMTEPEEMIEMVGFLWFVFCSCLSLVFLLLLLCYCFLLGASTAMGSDHIGHVCMCTTSASDVPVTR
jgi:hypothetical protein